MVGGVVSYVSRGRREDVASRVDGVVRAVRCVDGGGGMGMTGGDFEVLMKTLA